LNSSEWESNCSEQVLRTNFWWENLLIEKIVQNLPINESGKSLSLRRKEPC
jgi:hypothetical protein